MGGAGAPNHAAIPINRKTGHARCRPRDATSATSAVSRNVTLKHWTARRGDPTPNASNAAAAPHHATVGGATQIATFAW